MTRCTKDGCTLPGQFAGLCVAHASAAGDPAARADQSRRRRRLPPDFSTHRDRPVDFARDVFGLECWTRQAELVQAVAEHDRVSCRSGHKTGKTMSVALLAVWFSATRAGARVVLTAPSARQVRHVDWRETKRLCGRLPSSLLEGEQINNVPEIGIELLNGSQILGFTSDQPERFAGISGEHLLFLVDEASGISQDIFEAIEGSAAGGAKIVMLGNPTRPSGVFFDSFHDSKDSWHGIHISSEESPNVAAGQVVIPGLATKRWIAERAADWGIESPLYAVRVLGSWPAQSSQAVIGMALCDAQTAAWRREAFAESTEPTVLGVDPARFGADESVVMAVRGLTSLPPWVFRGLDTIALAREVQRIAHEVRRGDEEIACHVDETGLGGGVVDQLRTLDGLDVLGINAGESPGNPQYQRRRDELWFGIERYLKGGGTLPPDRKLAGELVAVEYGFSPTGKIVVEGKDDLRKRLGRSPDRADALALAVHRRRTKSLWQTYAEMDESDFEPDPYFW